MKKYFAILLIAAVLAGCSSPVKRTDPTDPSRQSLRLGQADVNETVRTMVDSMLSSRPVQEASTARSPAPTIVIIPIRLDSNTITDTRINTDAMTTLVREGVINSGLFRFVDATRRADIAAEVAYQRESGRVDPNTAVATGRQVGADYILEGTISGFEDRTRRAQTTGYVISMTVQDLETGIILWQQTQQVAKAQEKGLFGW